MITTAAATTAIETAAAAYHLDGVPGADKATARVIREAHGALVQLWTIGWVQVFTAAVAEAVVAGAEADALDAGVEALGGSYGFMVKAQG